MPSLTRQIAVKYDDESLKLIVAYVPVTFTGLPDESAKEIEDESDR
jgi:hypothetical protein